MWPDGVVEGLQVSEYIILGGGPGGVVLEMNQLAFEAAEEILCHGVVVGIALAGHALLDSHRTPAAPGKLWRRTGRPGHCER